MDPDRTRATMSALRSMRGFGSVSRPREADPKIAALRSLQGEEPDADEFGGMLDFDDDDKARPPSDAEIQRRMDRDEGYIVDPLGEIDDADLSPTQRVELEQGYRLPQAQNRLREDEVRLRDGRVMPIDDALGGSAMRRMVDMGPDPYEPGAQRPNIEVEIRAARARR